jgi:hypothetical protein
MIIDAFKVETDVSIHNQEDVIGMKTDEVCVPQECEAESDKRRNQMLYRYN